jgi:hypothetical protein
MLQHSIKGEFEYWGDPDFINGILAKLDTGRSIGSGQAATGIAIDGYLVKMFTRRIINQEEKDKFVNEIEVSDLLKQRIPNYVSHIYGAKYNPANSYIIYNLLDGLRLDQYLTILLNKWYDTDMSIKRMEDSQNSIEKKQYELLKETHTNLGYVSNDIFYQIYQLIILYHLSYHTMLVHIQLMYLYPYLFYFLDVLKF